MSAPNTEKHFPCDEKESRLPGFFILYPLLPCAERVGTCILNFLHSSLGGAGQSRFVAILADSFSLSSVPSTFMRMPCSTHNTARGAQVDFNFSPKEFV
jgi:hypothetical protein